MTKPSNLPLITDADERALSMQAIEARYAYPLDRAVARAFQRVAQLFHRTQMPANHLSHHPAQ